MSLETMHAMAEALDRGETTSRSLVERALARNAAQPELRAFLTLCEEQALAAADAADTRRKTGGKLSAMDGIPVAIKDNICTKGVRTTCASRMLENFVPPYDATVIRKLGDAGAIVVGKTNMDEFAMGSSTENSAFGSSRNPWNTECVPGGSSGGSAAAVAGGIVPGALGSDTGGSIRQPASFTGLTGIKPTYGRVSRYGLVAFASSLDQIGPFTRDVEDAAMLLQAISGRDPLDSTSADVPVPDYRAALKGASVKGLRIGKPREFFPSEGLNEEVRSSVERAVELLKQEGAEIMDITMPHTNYAIATYYLVATAEASSNLARYDGAHYGHRTAKAGNIIEMFSRTRAEGFGPEVKRRIMMGTHALSAGYYDAFYMKALRVRTLIKGDYDKAFENVDLIIGPTTPTAAFRIGEKSNDPLNMYLSDIFTISLNLSGHCGMSMPCGLTSAGLPIGVQLFARAFDEDRMLRTASVLERLLGFAQRVP